MNELYAKIIVWSIIAACVVYDAIAFAKGWTTISDEIRLIDISTGGLVRWIWLALWLHFFVATSWPGSEVMK